MINLKEIYEKLKNMNFPWLIDPKDKKPSVSLTLMVFSIIIFTIVGVLLIFNKINTMGPFQELLYATIALYFGRRTKIADKEYGPQKD